MGALLILSSVKVPAQFNFSNSRSKVSQAAGAHIARDPAEDAGGGMFPGPPVGVDAGGGKLEARRGNEVGNAAVQQHGPL